MDGGAGADTMTGGKGSDTYVVDVGDRVIESANSAPMLRTSLTLYRRQQRGEPDLHRHRQFHRTGMSGSNVIIGGSGATISMAAMVSTPTIGGGLGNDTDVVSRMDDIITSSSPTRASSSSAAPRTATRWR
ncbi:hypothetical protein AB5I41_07725 [Sphingomonas sp. MMS24-JH45]